MLFIVFTVPSSFAEHTQKPNGMLRSGTIVPLEILAQKLFQAKKNRIELFGLFDRLENIESLLLYTRECGTRVYLFRLRATGELEPENCD